MKLIVLLFLLQQDLPDYSKNLQTFFESPKDCDNEKMICSLELEKALENFQKKENEKDDLEEIIIQMVYYLKASQKTKIRLIMKEFLKKYPQNYSFGEEKKKRYEILRNIVSSLPKDQLLFYFLFSIDPGNELGLYAPISFSRPEIQELFSSPYDGQQYPRFWYVYFHHYSELKGLWKSYQMGLKKNWSIYSDMHSFSWAISVKD